ncbi:putative F-box protein At1g47800 [Rutidosis leptorrhynchoides]|uniref:putative F-box protein At1g47800 n=1 Tax=Rutidosis leptorrhynchoides TaxID=125765 RepID=UPI003A994567
MAKKRKTMSNYIPFEIQIKIFCQLPVKSILRFRSVSKEWKSLIDSSEFNSDYIAKRQRLLIIRCRGYIVDDVECETGEYCWIVDDDGSFSQYKSSLKYPRFVNRRKVKQLYVNRENVKPWYVNLRSIKGILNISSLQFVGTSHGLLCFINNYVYCFDHYVIWNPSIRKSVAINEPYSSGLVSYGFGVCPHSLDPKIIRIIGYWQVEIFTLSGGVWRSPLTKLQSKWLINIRLCAPTSFAINGFIYWGAFVSHKPIVGNCLTDPVFTIVSFNLVTEEFTKIDVPSKLSRRRNLTYFELFKLRESLGVVRYEYKGSEKDHNVWLMDHVSKSFSELFTVTLPLCWKVVGFRDNDQLILVNTADKYEAQFVAYDPYSKQFNHRSSYYLGCTASSTSSYTESLLLLNRSDTVDDDEGDAHIASFEDHRI